MTIAGQQERSSTDKRTSSTIRNHFRTRAATDDARQLLRRLTTPAKQGSRKGGRLNDPDVARYADSYGTIAPGQDDSGGRSHSYEYSVRCSDRSQRGQPSRTTSRCNVTSNKRASPRSSQPVVNETSKLGTFSGVFVPTSLNVFSILMFIRFGFVLGQGGVVGTFIMLLAAYAINLVTTLSISAVASNGTVRGGGAYYLISRSLGPEFGGSIGIISYLGFVFNTGMNVVGLVDCLAYDFGSTHGIWARWLIEGGWWSYFWGSLIVLACVMVCFAGSAIFARASNGLLFVLMVSIISIPLSAVLRPPFFNGQDSQYTKFTGLSMATLRENWLPHLTRGAAGSQLLERETYRDLFGILFPATGGIFAGASMSGDLTNPSKSIPRGTLYGVLVTFLSYTMVILAMAATITRETLYRNINVVQDTNLSGTVIFLGEMSTSLFSILMGIVGPAKQLQAMARDGIFPGLGIFGQGTAKSDEPIFAILLTWALTQVSILFDINSIASLVTMSYLMMSLSLHLACLLLKLSSAPNFRPSFHFFNQWTALAGVVLSIASMFFVDGVAATACIIISVSVFLLIHWTTPPKPWGSDVTSGLVYHQVRKYLLRLKTERVKYWRPQILLLVNDPRNGYRLIRFANSLKKGGLFILGHVIVTDNFGTSVPEARRQQAAWAKYIDHIKIKSFVNVAISPTIEWGARNLVLSAGLGGMRPNIVMMGFYNLHQFRQEQPLVDVRSAPPKRTCSYHRIKTESVEGFLPTDTCFVEKRTDLQSYVLVLEDMILKLQTNVAVAVGFKGLEMPPHTENPPKYIDLWPIQMSAEITSDTNGPHNMVTTNFDTYTLILQLGYILNTVPAYKKHFRLRIAVFVEHECDVAEERSRVKSLLERLRIKADVLVFWLACGDITSYEHIVNGKQVDGETEMRINKVLEHDTWWHKLATVRGPRRSSADVLDAQQHADDSPSSSRQSLPRGRESPILHFDAVRRVLQESRCRPSFSDLSRLGVSFNIQTNKLDEQLIERGTCDQGESDHSGYNADSDDNESIVACSGSPFVDLYPKHHVNERKEAILKDPYDLRSQEERIRRLFLQRTNTVGSAQLKDSKSPLTSISEVGQASQSANVINHFSRYTDTNRRLFQAQTVSYDRESRNLPKSVSDRIHRYQPFHQETESFSIDRVSSNSAQQSNALSHEHQPHRVATLGASQVPGHLAQPDYFSYCMDAAPRESRAPTVRRERHKDWPATSSFPVDFTSHTPEASTAVYTGPPISTPLRPSGVTPSVTFAEAPHPRRQSDNESAGQLHPRSIYQRSIDDVRSPPVMHTAWGFPSAASAPLSFNELPSRAQHLILNELMSQQSNETAVIFTTLPAPEEGTWKNESDSLTYLMDLEVLTQDLGPVLLVHSNSMTVTTNL